MRLSHYFFLTHPPIRITIRTRMKTIESIIRGLHGAIALEKLDEGRLSTVKSHCPVVEHNGFADILYSGLKAVLEREEVWVLLKDTGFRLPPGKTVYLVEEAEEQERETREDRQFLRDGERLYRIIGEELFAGEEKPEEPHFLLSDGFALFTERRSGTRHRPAWFLIPPIAFPELEERKEELGIRNIVSVSPSAGSDMLLREMFGFDPSPRYATILIGMDRQIRRAS